MSNPKQVLDLTSAEFKPRNEYILIKPIPIKTEKVSDGGILVPMLNKSVNDRPTSGDVIDVGDDINDIKTGDVVIWPGTDGLDLELNDGDFMLLRYKSVIGTKK